MIPYKHIHITFYYGNTQRFHDKIVHVKGTRSIEVIPKSIENILAPEWIYSTLPLLQHSKYVIILPNRVTHMITE